MSRLWNKVSLVVVDTSRWAPLIDMNELIGSSSRGEGEDIYMQMYGVLGGGYRFGL